MQLDPDQLAALREILARGSFDAAAAALGVSPSAVSQRLKALEERIGSALILRGAPCRATSIGRRLARHADAVALLETELARDLGAGAQPARVRIAVNADSLGTWLPEALARTRDLLFALEADDQDHSAEWLREGAVAAAVTSRGKPVRGCDCHPLGALRYLATASPAFRETWFPDGLTADALSRAPMLQFDAKDRLQIDWAHDVARRAVFPPTHMIPSTHAFVDAAIAGLGWGLNPEPLVRAHLASGRLVALSPRPVDVPLFWQIARHLSDPLADLTRAVRATAPVATRPDGTGMTWPRALRIICKFAVT